jgi:hypothetical protein
MTSERVAQNQIAFRDANERLGEAAERLLGDETLAPFLCECPDRSCTEIVRLSLSDYERVRARGDWFLVAPGHEVCVVDGVDTARVESRHERWSLMEKIAEAGAIARAADPRS